MEKTDTVITPLLIDRLFSCMSEFYGERWQRQFDKPHRQAFCKSIWKSALTGLTEDAIRKALVHYKQEAKLNTMLPPTPMEFYRAAKKHMPNENLLPLTKKNAEEHLAEIKALVNMKMKIQAVA